MFKGKTFVICNFVPHKVDCHPLAMLVPYYHSNVDSDGIAKAEKELVRWL